MVKIIEKKEVPTAQVRCRNCGSLLEYGNADLHERISYNYSWNPLRTASGDWYFVCPVCGCEVTNVSWVEENK